jgi:hypothetical protein
MAAVWNMKDLRPPPTLTYEIQLSYISKYIENVYFNMEPLTKIRIIVGFTQHRIESTVFAERRNLD